VVVTPSASAGGSIDPSTPVTIPSSATQAFTLTPDPGFRIASVGGSCGGTLAGFVYTTAPVSVDCSVEANFAPKFATSTTLDAAPNPARAGQTVAFTAVVTGSTSAPPDGQVEVSASTGESCTDVDPASVAGNAATFGCSISFATLGPRQVNANFSASDEHADSAATPLSLAVVRLADVTVSIDDGAATVAPGQAVDYLVELRNLGPDDAPDTVLALLSAPPLLDAGWSCTPVGAALCPAASGSGELGATVSLPVGSGLDLTQSGTAPAALGSGLVAQVSASVDAAAPNHVLDPDTASNEDSDSNASTRVFADGFE
jgi:hypothetical protein